MCESREKGREEERGGGGGDQLEKGLQRNRCSFAAPLLLFRKIRPYSQDTDHTFQLSQGKVVKDEKDGNDGVGKHVKVRGQNLPKSSIRDRRANAHSPSISEFILKRNTDK